MPDKQVIMDVRHLTKWFPIKRGLALKTVGNVKAVDDVSFQVYEGETLGLVGESGCGKTTLVRSMLRLIEPTGGEIFYKGEDFRKLDKKELKGKRKDVQIVFQDPFGSLHPKMRIRTILEEPLIINHYGDKEARMARVKELMRLVDLKEEQLDRYPHEFSGGQRQRIVIARALATNPGFVVLSLIHISLAGGLENLDVHVRVSLRVQGQNLPQPFLPAALGDSHRQVLLAVAGDLRHLQVQLGFHGHDVADASEVMLARVGEGDGVLGAVEKPHAKGFFQLVDALCEGGLGYKTFLCGSGKALALVQGDQVFKPNKIHVEIPPFYNSAEGNGVYEIKL